MSPGWQNLFRASGNSFHPDLSLICALQAEFSLGPTGEFFAQSADVQPLVSFVVPVRNDAERLQRCLASIVANTYARALVEIIVVDNESTDGSARVAREYGAVVITSRGQSVAAHRNRGARVALGSIIAFADSDHQIDRSWIEHAVSTLSDPSVAAAGAPYLAEPSANWVQLQYDGLRHHPVAPHEVDWLGSGNFAIKRAVFDKIGGFDATLTACEDVDLCNRIRLAGGRIIADPKLSSIHFGDPRTLKALFLGELWRGRDNLRVTFNGPKTFAHLRSALVPVAQLGALAVAVTAALLQSWRIAAPALIVALAPAAIRAAIILRRRLRPTLAGAAQALAVAVVFDVARASAVLVRGSHRARRSA